MSQADTIQKFVLIPMHYSIWGWIRTLTLGEIPPETIHFYPNILSSVYHNFMLWLRHYYHKKISKHFILMPRIILSG